jgi:hypothetical protein
MKTYFLCFEGGEHKEWASNMCDVACLPPHVLLFGVVQGVGAFEVVYRKVDMVDVKVREKRGKWW